MNGIEKITARIRADAEAECAAIRAESEERCAAIRAESARMDHICQLHTGNREEAVTC